MARRRWLTRVVNSCLFRLGRGPYQAAIRQGLGFLQALAVAGASKHLNDATHKSLVAAFRRLAEISMEDPDLLVGSISAGLNQADQREMRE